MEAKDIGIRIDEIREKKHISVEDMCAKAHVSSSRYSSHSNGLTAMTLDTFLDYIRVLNVTADDVLNDEYINMDLTRYEVPNDPFDLYPFNVLRKALQYREDFFTVKTLEEHNKLEASIEDTVHKAYYYGLLKVIRESLTPREHAVIIFRYISYFTYDKIASFYKVTRERIRQIEKSALRKISNPARDKYWKLYLKDDPESNVNAAKEAGDPLDKSIAELDLSVRSYNCLRRKGINTIRELSELSVEDLMKVRNLGKHSLEEILSKLEERGIVIVNSNI